MPSAERRLAKKTAAALAAAAPHLTPADRAKVAALARRGEARIIEEIRAALDYLNDELTADRVVRLVVPNGGGVCTVASYVDADHGARHRAAVELLSVYGLYPSKTAGGSGNVAAAKVEITLRSAERVESVQVVEVPVTPAN